jgi:predicted NBD/HSP70 family sugar kinase
MLELVAAGDRGARRAVSEAGEAVGRAAAALVNILNPELVVIGGDLAQTGEVLLDPIAAGIERHSVAPAVASVRVCAGLLGERAEVLGAAALVLSKSPRALVEQLNP